MSDPQNINQQALLVSLHFTLPRQSRQSKSESARVEAANAAASGTTRVNLFYFQQTVDNKVNDALFEVKQLFNAWRSEHARLTRGWDDGSTRLLPCPLIQRYMNMTSRFEEEAPAVANEFFANHNDWLLTAPVRMGHLYDQADFPSLDECRKAVGWSKSMIPLPSSEQWKRISIISPDLAATMENTTNERIHEAVEAARLQTWQDVLAPIQQITEVLSKDKPRIFTSLIGNLNTILELCPHFNLSNDAALNQLVAQAKESLSTVDPEELRRDPDLRKETLKNAQEILSRFGNLGQRRFAV